eukprot:tig00021179_g19261.t1
MNYLPPPPSSRVLAGLCQADRRRGSQPGVPGVDNTEAEVGADDFRPDLQARNRVAFRVSFSIAPNYLVVDNKAKNTILDFLSALYALGLAAFEVVAKCLAGYLFALHFLRKHGVLKQKVRETTEDFRDVNEDGEVVHIGAGGPHVLGLDPKLELAGGGGGGKGGGRGAAALAAAWAASRATADVHVHLVDRDKGQAPGRRSAPPPADATGAGYDYARRASDGSAYTPLSAGSLDIDVRSVEWPAPPEAPRPGDAALATGASAEAAGTTCFPGTLIPSVFGPRPPGQGSTPAASAPASNAASAGASRHRAYSVA